MRFLGDPKHADVPIEKLLSAKYVEAAAERVRTTVKNKKPVMLVALPHAAGKGSNISLEISGDVQKSIFIDERIVVLLRVDDNNLFFRSKGILLSDKLLLGPLSVVRLNLFRYNLLV